MIHKREIELPGVGTLEVVFRPRGYPTDAETAAARQAMLSAVAGAFQTVPPLARFREAASNYAQVRELRQKAEADLAALRRTMEAPELVMDGERYFAASVEIERLERLVGMYAARLDALRPLIRSSRPAAVLALTRIAAKAIEPAEKADNAVAFAAVVTAAEAAAGGLLAEPCGPLLRDINPESEAERAVADLLPDDLRPGYSPPPPDDDGQAVELPPGDPSTGALASRPGDRSTVTRHEWHEGPPVVVVPNGAKPVDYELVSSLRPGSR